MMTHSFAAMNTRNVWFFARGCLQSLVCGGFGGGYSRQIVPQESIQ